MKAQKLDPIKHPKIKNPILEPIGGKGITPRGKLVIKNSGSGDSSKKVKGLKVFKGGQPVKVIKTNIPNPKPMTQNLEPLNHKPVPIIKKPVKKPEELNLAD